MDAICTRTARTSSACSTRSAKLHFIGWRSMRADSRREIYIRRDRSFRAVTGEPNSKPCGPRRTRKRSESVHRALDRATDISKKPLAGSEAPRRTNRYAGSPAAVEIAARIQRGPTASSTAISPPRIQPLLPIALPISQTIRGGQRLVQVDQRGGFGGCRACGSAWRLRWRERFVVHPHEGRIRQAGGRDLHGTEKGVGRGLGFLRKKAEAKGAVGNTKVEKELAEDVLER